MPKLRSNQTRFLSYRWSQVIWQSLAIVIIAMVISLSVNALRHAKLPLFADWSASAHPSSASGGDNLAISLEDAAAFFFDQGAVFLDARSKEQFRKGHLEGARNLPWEDFDRRFSEVMANIPHDAIIITYCDGENCSLSRELASALLAKGYDHVRVFVDGWKMWQQFDFPMAQ